MSTLHWRKMESVPASTRIRPPALSRYFEASGDAAALLIHGFTGIPEEMEYLGRRLFETGLTVSIPRLPGHGTNREDFHAVTWRNWYRRCVDSYLELTSRYAKVCVGGLSMGGLLTILLAAQFAVPRIALAAPALLTTRSALRLVPLARLVLKSVPNRGVDPERETDPDLRYIEKEYRQHRWLGPLAELRKLQKLARARLPLVRSETLTIVSRNDRTVPLSAADLVESRISAREKKCIVLEESSHVVVNDVDRERVADEISNWFMR